jgi:glyoxylase-like metal-dependent hydrolase (beta-lactamase superfamily II)
MLKWTIGEVTVRRLVEQTAELAHETGFMPAASPAALRAMPWLVPDFATADGRLRMSIHALLVEAPGIRLVVDTCFGDKPRKLKRMQPVSVDLPALLVEAGWPREGVDLVVCTHLHVDHVGWNTMRDGDRWVPTFPNARYLIGRAEYDHWSRDNDALRRDIMADSVQPIFEAGLVDLVETDHRISPELRLIPTLGHTPGHVSVLIESNGEFALITGDAIHHPCQIARPEWCASIDSDPGQSAATRHGLLATLADKPILLIGTHFMPPTAGHVVTDGDALRLAT